MAIDNKEQAVSQSAPQATEQTVNSSERQGEPSATDQPSPDGFKGLMALSPLLVFIVLYLLLSLVAHNFSRVPMTVVFLIASVYAIAMSGRYPLKTRIDIYSRGASTPNLLLMLWIYVLAGRASCKHGASRIVLGCLLCVYLHWHQCGHCGGSCTYCSRCCRANRK